MALLIGQATQTSVRSANSDQKNKKTTHTTTAASPTPNSLRVPKASVRSADAEATKNKKIVDK